MTAAVASSSKPTTPRPITEPRLVEPDDLDPLVRLAGAVTGAPSIRRSALEGRRAAQAVAAELYLGGRVYPADGALDLLIVGAGPCGLSANLEATRLGLRTACVAAGEVGGSIAAYTRGKWVHDTTPGADDDEPVEPALFVGAAPKEELLGRWRRQLAAAGSPTYERERVLHARREGEVLRVECERRHLTAHRLLAGIGLYGAPRRSGVIGEADAEEAGRLRWRLDDPADYRDRAIVIYGAGNTALEAAVRLCGHNDVMLVARDAALGRAHPNNVRAVEAAVAAGRLRLRLGTALCAIGEASLLLRRRDGGTELVGYDVLFEMIGRTRPPVPFLEALRRGPTRRAA